MQVFFILFVLFSCTHKPTDIIPEQTNPDSPTEIAIPEPQLPEPQTKISLTIPACTNCTDAQWARIVESTKKVNEVMHGQCFKDFMLNRKMIQTDGMTNAQVVEKLISGNMDVSAEMYYTWKSVLGYTYPDVMKIWINRKFMLSWNVCDLASLLAHEGVAHKNGFGHDFNYSSSRDYSVPYSVNYAFDQCCK